MVGYIGSRLDELKALNKRYSSVWGERGEFIRYLHRGDVLAQKLWQPLPVDQCVATMSVAAMHKSQGQQLRKILMCCTFNFLCKPISLLIGHEPHYGLRGVEALSQCFTDQSGFAFAALDESNAFTSVLAPMWWRKYM